MASIELFLQGEGIPQVVLIEVPEEGLVREIIEVARTQGLHSDGVEERVVFLEGADEPLAPDALMAAAGIRHRGHVHVHRRRLVEITVNFNAQHIEHVFSPATTVHAVKEWADDQFGLKGVDAMEHALQICGTGDRPTEDTHIGRLLTPHAHTLCFDLVPKKRIEG